MRDYIEELSKLSSQELDNRLKEAMKTRPLDRQYILSISHILEEREADLPIPNDPAIKRAWEEFNQSERADAAFQRKKARRWLKIAGAAAAILCVIVLAIPRSAEALDLGKLLVRWGTELVEFFNPRTDAGRNYQFHTDHPGLQQVYDTAVELGFQDPPVPKWIPETYELTEIVVSSAGEKPKVEARFTYEDSRMVLAVRENSNTASECPTDEGWIPWEFNRLDGYVFTNEGQWVGIGIADTMELAIIVDAEGLLYRIMDSVYTG